SSNQLCFCIIETNQDATLFDIPVLEDLSAECSLSVIAPSTTDVCAGTITGTTSDPLEYSEQGTYVINWTFDDGNGNSIDVAQNVLIIDLTPPSATCPDDIITCDGSVSNIGLSDVTDNCSTPDITYELSGATTGSGSGDASAEIFAPGETTLTYTLDDGNGNSSLCTFKVTHQVVDEIVVNLADGILSVETPGSYQWINCDDNSVVEGETGSSYNPGVNGEYAVIVTQGTCSGTSECYLVDYTGLQSNGLYDGLELYPNPADRFITIKLDRENTNLTIKVISTSGQAVLVESMDRLTETRLDISNIKAGMYLIQIHSDQTDRMVRFVKE
ncbi:MAG: T9SS type A sorting domain-containing protein, partial [Bacteroides sp.]|nr:T9SS type A sorting domain-containing protein [Bacteroides sp.]